MTHETPDNTLIAMILRRCGLDDHALPLLGAIESAAWSFVGEETDVDGVRQALALLGRDQEAWIDARTGASPALRELLRAMIRARASSVPTDVVASFAVDAIRTAILIEDAFRRGHQLALEGPPRPPARLRERRVVRRVAH